MRDVIIYAGWPWETMNVPERIALAARAAGARVMHVGAPKSILRKRSSSAGALPNDIQSFQPIFLSSRMLRGASAGIQAAWIAQQIAAESRRLELRDPVFCYGYLGGLLPLAGAMSTKGFDLAHLRLDHVMPEEDAHADPADAILTIQRTTFHKLAARFGARVVRIQQAADVTDLRATTAPAPRAFLDIPGPRLVYGGALTKRLNLPLLREVLLGQPWSFIAFGGDASLLPLSNVHVLPWMHRSDLAACLREMDVALLPYDCGDEFQLHCTPLKLYEALTFGKPIVATPLVELWPHTELLDVADTAPEMRRAIERALKEDGTRAAMRRALAEAHSIESLAAQLAKIPLLAEGG